MPDVVDGLQILMPWAPVDTLPSPDDIGRALTWAAAVITHSRRRPLYPPRGMSWDDFRQAMQTGALPRVRKFRFRPELNERRRLAGKRTITLQSYCYRACWYEAIDIIRSHRASQAQTAPRDYPLLDHLEGRGPARARA